MPDGGYAVGNRYICNRFGPSDHWPCFIDQDISSTMKKYTHLAIAPALAAAIASCTGSSALTGSPENIIPLPAEYSTTGGSWTPAPGATLAVEGVGSTDSARIAARLNEALGFALLPARDGSADIKIECGPDDGKDTGASDEAYSMTVGKDGVGAAALTVTPSLPTVMELSLIHI